MVEERARRTYGDVVDKSVQRGMLRKEDDTGLGAELTGAEVGGVGVPGEDLLPTSVHRRTGDEHGVDAAHLTVEGDGVGTGDGQVVQSTPPGDGPGEAHCPGEGVGDGELARLKS